MVEQAIKQFIEQTKNQVQPAVLLPRGWDGDILVDVFYIHTRFVAAPVVTSLDAARALIYGSICVPQPQDGVQVAPLGDDDDE